MARLSDAEYVSLVQSADDVVAAARDALKSAAALVVDAAPHCLSALAVERLVAIRKRLGELEAADDLNAMTSEHPRNAAAAYRSRVALLLSSLDVARDARRLRDDRGDDNRKHDDEHDDDPSFPTNRIRRYLDD